PFPVIRRGRRWEGVRADADRTNRAGQPDLARRKARLDSTYVEGRSRPACLGAGIGPILAFVRWATWGRRESTQQLVKFPMEVPVHRTEDCGMGALGTNLREARERLGLTQEQVAQRSGVHATEVSRIEAGKRDPQVSTGEKLARAVELRPGELLD